MAEEKPQNMGLFEEEDLQGVTVPRYEGEPLFDKKQIVDAAYEHFRKTGFPYRNLPLHVCMQQINRLARTPNASLLKTNEAYQVADTYHPHRFHGSAQNMRSPLNAYLDDRIFRIALEKELRYSEIPAGFFAALNWVNGTQVCSNFRPGFACYLYRKYCKAGDTVLDCSTGYGGRLVGYIASRVGGRYIGIDPSTATHEANLRMAGDLYDSEKVELYNLPVEDVDAELLRGRCDFAFTSPPYFSKELYCEELTQSCHRYGNDFEAWTEGFLRPFFTAQCAALKAGAFAIVNIADVNLRGKSFPLVETSKRVGVEQGLRYIKTEEFALQCRLQDEDPTVRAVEPVLVFQKGG